MSILYCLIISFWILVSFWKLIILLFNSLIWDFKFSFSFLNLNIPATIAPQNIQAIITGAGDNFGQIKYIKEGLSENFSEESIVYTSGTGAIFKSGIPIGKLRTINDDSKKQFYVEFFSDFSQLKYVFAEVVTKTVIEKTDQQSSDDQQTPIETKIKIKK